METVPYIWLDGALVPWEKAQTHVLTHTLHYGLGVFEGIRCYDCGPRGSAIFRLREHVRRLFDSAHICLMEIPYSRSDIEQAIVETVRANDLAACYIRPIVFLGAGPMGLYAPEAPVVVAIAAWSWGSYLGETGLTHGIRVKISSFARHHVNVAMTKAKVCGHYANSIIAKHEAKGAGFDEALMLDIDGFVSEGSGENVFIVRDGVVKTTPLTCVLDGITRDTIIKLIREAGYELREERFTRDELYVADEAFFTGTAAELTPIREVDERRVGTGKPGPVTRLLQKKYFAAVHGELPEWDGWLTFL
jgi:branched-chain amino acid aminotransferase